MKQTKENKHYFHITDNKIDFYGGSFRAGESEQHFKELVDYFRGEENEI